MTKDKWLEVLAQATTYCLNPYTRTIYLHSIDSYDGEEVGIDFRAANTFIKAITFLSEQGKENILIHQCSDGGNKDYAMAIYDAIKTCVSPVTMIAHGQASSMSSVTLQAAKKRILMPSCSVMVHYGYMGVDDNSAGAHAHTCEDQRVNKMLLDIYSERCRHGEFFKGMSKKKVAETIDRKIKDKVHWFMTAKEAVGYGFADGILGTRGFETIGKVRKA